MVTAQNTGQKTKKGPRVLSEYGKQLQEKQKLKNLYNLREAQLAKLVKEILGSRSKNDKDIAYLLIKSIEERLDNVIFRLGLAVSRPQARQLISHKHFLVNDKSVNIPSQRVKKGDVIKLKQKSIAKKIFQNIVARLKKHTVPSWLSWDLEKLEAKVIGEPTLDEVASPVEIHLIFEYYSK